MNDLLEWKETLLQNQRQHKSFSVLAELAGYISQYPSVEIIAEYTNLAVEWANGQRQLELEVDDTEAQACQKRQCEMIAMAISTFELRELKTELREGIY